MLKCSSNNSNSSSGGGSQYKRHRHIITSRTPLAHGRLAIPTVYYLQCTFLFETVGLALWYRTHRFSFFRVFPLRFSVSRDFIVCFVRWLFFFLFSFGLLFFGFFVCCYSNLLRLHAFCKISKVFFGRELARMQKVMCVCL